MWSLNYHTISGYVCDSSITSFINKKYKMFAFDAFKNHLRHAIKIRNTYIQSENKE